MVDMRAPGKNMLSLRHVVRSTGVLSAMGSIMRKKDMWSTYCNRSELELRKLRSKHVNRLEKLRQEARTYFVQQEIKREAYLIDRIDSVLRWKQAQESFE